MMMMMLPYCCSRCCCCVRQVPLLHLLLKHQRCHLHHLLLLSLPPLQLPWLCCLLLRLIVLQCLPRLLLWWYCCHCPQLVEVVEVLQLPTLVLWRLWKRMRRMVLQMPLLYCTHWQQEKHARQLLISCHAEMEGGRNGKAKDGIIECVCPLVHAPKKFTTPVQQAHQLQQALISPCS